MNFRTFLSLLRGGGLKSLWALGRAARGYHRVSFLASGLSSGLLARLASGPQSLEALSIDLQIAPSMRDGLRAWLQAGVALGELAVQPAGYTLNGKLARMLTDERHDAAAAFIEEVAYLHNALFTQAPERLRSGVPFTLADQNARMIARSSRLCEPFIREALTALLPMRGSTRLLEIGCGAAAYIRFAASRNPELRALGIDLQADAAALAAENIAKWNLGDRVSIEMADIREKSGDASFDIATLHQNIYYFPVVERIGVLRHVRSFLKRGGRLLLTTICQGSSPTSAVIDLWGAITAECGRLPSPAEMVGQMKDAGFNSVEAKSLIPGESFYAFWGTNPGR